MVTERSPLLPTATAAQASPTRRVVALLVVGVVVVVAAVALAMFDHWSPPEARAVIGGTTQRSPTDAFPADAYGRRDVLSQCDERFITQRLDHFDADNDGVYEQRYFICGRSRFDPQHGAIFFYTGNEADVELYVNHTGLMWENAEAFGAVLVFAEHRFFGKSVPFPDAPEDKRRQSMTFLSSKQALADYTVLLEFLQRDWHTQVPVIAFGGSYGGMLALWLRLTAPQLVAGAIAASAPVLHFLGDPSHPDVDTNAFRRIVAFDMSTAAGASAHCIPNVRKAVAALRRLSETPDGRALIGETLRMCSPDMIQSPRDADALIYAAIGAFGNLAMGNYPYPTSYLTEGAVVLPAYPVRAACEHLAIPSDDSHDGDIAVLAALRDAVGVYYNATGAMPCYFPVSAPSETNQTVVDISNVFGYLACTELYMPMSSDGADGVFPRDDLNMARDDANCMATWGVHLRPHWVSVEYGGLAAIRASSNIVVSNGNYDPLSGTGVLANVSETVVAIEIEGGAHHVDLFFRDPRDPPALTRARETEKHYMRTWVREFYADKTTAPPTTGSSA